MSSTCNCVRDCTCPKEQECCTESDNPANAKPTFGTCCKKGTCDRKRGICYGNLRTRVNNKTEREDFNFIVEGYDDSDDSDSDDEWTSDSTKSVVITLAVIILLALGLTMVGVKDRYS